MTTEEMFEMRINGATYQEIADACGLTRQGVHERVRNYSKRRVLGYRGHGFYVGAIKYKGIREYFESKPCKSISSFAKKVGVYHYNMRNFLYDETETRFTIQQIKNMCEVIGKPFEDVFGGVGNE